MSEIRIAQFFKLTSAKGDLHYYQNYFINQAYQYNGVNYSFVPFKAQGTTAGINGDNDLLQILFPNLDAVLRLVEVGDYNRLSSLELVTAVVNALDQIVGSPLTEYYTGVGASYSETTVELRFRSAIDSVGSAFPARTLTRQLVGPLPLNSELYLR